MKLLLKANCPTNEYWAACAFMCIEVNPDNIGRLVALREASLAFLKSQDIAASGFGAFGWGHVKLPSPLSFIVSEDADTNELLDSEKGDADVGDILQEDSFAEAYRDNDCRLRTECHMVQISADSVYLYAVSRDSGDYLEAELPLNFLIEKFPGGKAEFLPTATGVLG